MKMTRWYFHTSDLARVKKTDWISLVAQRVKNLPAVQAACKGFSPRVRKIPWKGEWLPTPVFLPGEFHGQRSLVGLQRESGMTGQLKSNNKKTDYKQCWQGYRGKDPLLDCGGINAYSLSGDKLETFPNPYPQVHLWLNILTSYHLFFFFFFGRKQLLFVCLMRRDVRKACLRCLVLLYSVHAKIVSILNLKLGIFSVRGY